MGFRFTRTVNQPRLNWLPCFMAKSSLVQDLTEVCHRPFFVQSQFV
jgi:hypothetical protein